MGYVGGRTCRSLAFDYKLVNLRKNRHCSRRVICLKQCIEARMSPTVAGASLERSTAHPSAAMDSGEGVPSRRRSIGRAVDRSRRTLSLLSSGRPLLTTHPSEAMRWCEDVARRRRSISRAVDRSIRVIRLKQWIPARESLPVAGASDERSPAPNGSSV